MPTRRRLSPDSTEWRIPPPPGVGRPVGSLNKVTNLMVAGLTGAMFRLGQEYAEAAGMPLDEVLSDRERLEAFLVYAARRDLKAFLQMAGKLIPRNVTLNIAADVRHELLAPPQLIEALEQRGIRMPQQYRISQGHANDDDTVSDADIVQAVERER